MNEQEIRFSYSILDNVHGFIPYTEAERKILSSLLFKRLQNIKQLSVVNWVFPGSEHTRYTHSLGVMHIADKIACKLGLSNGNRRILRLAGLLHDIGHYPLSHVCEFMYKRPLTLGEVADEEVCRYINELVRVSIDTLSFAPKLNLMEQSRDFHHEAIGADVVKSYKEIRDIIIEECDDQHAPDIIADIITGNVEREGTDPLLVQIIHSELDADGIDYLMRDSSYSGTSFGSFEIDQLIRCMKVCEYYGKKILCIDPKGVPAADQYLINKFFSYSQVVFNRHIVVSEWMAECVIAWMANHNAFLPKGSQLKEWVKKGKSEFISFTDNTFWAALANVLEDKLKDLVPNYIKVFCQCLLQHNEPAFVKNSEIRFVSTNEEQAREQLKRAEIYSDDSLLDQRITILSTRRMSNELPLEEFEKAIEEKKKASREEELEFNDIKLKAARFMGCISIASDDGNIHLLCEDDRSLMKTLYGNEIVMLRSYEFPQAPSAE